jgi:hypothetical protein
MKSSESFFASFQKAGFLKPASWTPSGGGGPYTANVRFTSPDAEILTGTVVAADYQIEYVTSQLPGLKEGETVVVASVSYKVRTPPTKILDGTVARASLKKA